LLSGSSRDPAPDWLVSPDGRLLATINLPDRKNGTRVLSPLVVRAIATGKTLVKIEEFGRFSVLRFSPDSKTLATLTREVKLYDLSSGQVRSILPIHEKEFWSTDGHFTPDGRLMVVVGSSRESAEIRWLNLDRGGAAKALPQPLGEEAFRSASISLAPDSKHVAFVSPVGPRKIPHLILVEIETGKLVRDFGEQAASPERLVFSPDGKQLTALFPDKLERWEVSTGKPLPPVDTRKPLAVQFSPDGKTLAVVTTNAVRCFDATTGAERYRIPCDASTDRQRVHGQGDAIAFSPDGKKLAVTHGRVIRQWDVATGQEIGPTPNLDTIHSVAAARDARWVAACSSRQVQLWDATGRVVLRVASWPDAERKQVALTAVALSADGRRLAVGGSDGAVEILSVPTGERLSQLRFHHAPVTSLVFVADGSELVTADLTHQAARWDAASGKQMHKYAVPPRADRGTPKGMDAGHEAWHELLGSAGSFSLHQSFGPVLSPDGERLVTLSQKALTIWRLNPALAQKPVIPQPHKGKFAVTADGRFLVTGPNWDESYYIDRDAALCLIDVVSGKTERIFANFPRIRNFDISPDGKLLAACSTDGLCLWDMARGTRRATFNGHRGTVTGVAFSPDGGTLVSAAQDGTVLAWDVARLVAAPALKALEAADLESLWNGLAAPDAQTAAHAMQRLTGHPEQAVALLRQRLKPAAVSKERLAQLVADLDDVRFDVREIATRELERLAELAEPTLRACLRAQPTLEQRQRVNQILARLGEPVNCRDKLRALRSVEMLVVIGTPGAIELLQTLAAGADGADETREARAVLKWIKR
jgi:WD40 repeat protein